VLELVRLRNTHPAFDGALDVAGDGSSLQLRWNKGDATCVLDVDLASGRAAVTAAVPESTVP
jgi:sucrose phosphorylase